MSKNNVKQNIPEGWTGTTLGNLMEFKNGLNKEKAAFGAGTPIVNYTDVYKKTSLESDDVAGLVTVTKNELVNNSAQKGDVFFTRTSETLLEIGMASVLLDDIKDCVFSGYILRGRPTSNEVLSKYFAHSLRTPSIRKEIMRKSSMTTRALTTGKFLGAVEYSYPPEEEQGRIIKTLDIWDEAVEKLDRVIELKKDVKKGLMQKLLTGGLRLPGFKGDWEVKSLVEVVTFLDSERIPIKSEERSNRKGPYPYYGASGVIDFVDDYIFDGEYILLGEDGANILDRSSRLAFLATGKIWVNNHAHVLQVKENADSHFLSEYLESLDYKKYNTGSAQPKLNRGVCEKIPVLLPPLLEQKEISKIIVNVDTEIELLQEKRRKTLDQKKYLLNNLVTGRLRTPENL
jgi:type I restriction enzyme S subunit